MFRSLATAAMVLLCLASLSCTQPPVDTTEEARAGIVRTNEAFMAAVASGDAPGVAACYTEDGEILPPNGAAVQGRSGLEEAFTGMLSSGIGGITLTSTEVEGHGDTAYEVGTYELRDADDNVLDVGKYIVVWKRAGDDWKLHRDIWNSDRPAPTAEPTEEGAEEPAE